jgi:hypothetical protein
MFLYKELKNSLERCYNLSSSSSLGVASSIDMVNRCTKKGSEYWYIVLIKASS